jgi:CRISPR-associated exonuclease Cas4
MNDLITVTDVVEHAFCPKFTYYGHVLKLEQFEQKRGTVQQGKMMHKRREKTNTSYIPQGIVGKKIIGLKIYSSRLGLSGKIDEAIELKNEIIVIEHKYSNRVEIGDTLKAQLGLLAILLEENLNKPVNTGIVIFTKENRKEIVVPIDESIRKNALDTLENVKNVIRTGKSPNSIFDGRCLDCCYRRVCPVGSLKTNE